MDKSLIIIAVVVVIVIAALAILAVNIRRKQNSIFRHQKNRYKDRTRSKKNPDGTVKRRKPLIGKRRHK